MSSKMAFFRVFLWYFTLPIILNLKIVHFFIKRFLIRFKQCNPVIAKVVSILGSYQTFSNVYKKNVQELPTFHQEFMNLLLAHTFAMKIWFRCFARTYNLHMPIKVLSELLNVNTHLIYLIWPNSFL